MARMLGFSQEMGVPPGLANSQLHDRHKALVPSGVLLPHLQTTDSRPDAGSMSPGLLVSTVVHSGPLEKD